MANAQNVLITVSTVTTFSSAELAPSATKPRAKPLPVRILSAVMKSAVMVSSMSNNAMMVILPMVMDAAQPVRKNLDGSAVVVHRTILVNAGSLLVIKFSFHPRVPSI